MQTKWLNIRGCGSYRQINATTCELRYRKDGKQLIRRIPCTPDQAREFLATEYIGRRKRGAGMIGGSWEQAKQAYYERQHQRGKNNHYIWTVNSLVDRLCKDCECKTPNDVTSDMVEKFLERDETQGSTKNKLRAMLSSFFRFCARRRYTSGNPVDGVERFDVVKKEPRRLTPEEYVKIYMAADAGLRDALEFLLFTGCRASEMINAEWGDIEHDRWLCGKRKRGINVTIPISPRLRMMLSIRRGHYKELFKEMPRGPFTCWSKKAMLNEIVKACAKAGVPKIKTHDLRHAAASWAIEAGSTKDQVKHLLGHTSSNTTEIYCNPSSVDVARTVQANIEKKLKGE